MSFSSEVKEELSKTAVSARHCRIAELAALISFCGKVTVDEDNSYSMKIIPILLTFIQKMRLLQKGVFRC